MSNTPILIEGSKLTLEQWLHELAGQLLKAAKAGHKMVCIETPLAVNIGRDALKYEMVLRARRVAKVKRNGGGE